MTDWIDATLTLHNRLPAWPGDPSPRISRSMSLKDGDIANSSRIEASLHWGTHLDAPYHIVESGWTLDQIPLSVLTGRCRVLEYPHNQHISAAWLKQTDLNSAERVFFKTGNSRFWSEEPLRFHPEFIALSPDAAEYLVSLGIKLVGLDYLSIDPWDSETLPVHHILYRHNIPAIEGLDLREVTAGDYEMVALPMRIANGDGSPVRVILKPVKKIGNKMSTPVSNR
ncbi:MAG: cyclase family protein [Calditrichia bacterium]